MNRAIVRAVPWVLTAVAAAAAAYEHQLYRRLSQPEIDAETAASASAIAFNECDEALFIARAEYPPSRSLPWFFWAGAVCTATMDEPIRHAHTDHGWARTRRSARAQVDDFLGFGDCVEVEDAEDLADL